MKISVVGPGCKNCKNLHSITKKLIESNYPETELEYVDNLQDMIELGVSQSPALVIDGVIVSQGKILGSDAVRQLIEEAK